ncbi:MAG: hypothetical protein COB98_03550 [Flavobacteriaceae bacterium]|nr:MAG: hypothetical protein COB98_03550 [Flavobacteriaceae bacterium]
MKRLHFVLLFIFNLSFSQNSIHQIFDSKTYEPIPFSAIVVVNNQQVSFFSDEKGVFNINKNKIDSIQILSLGYFNLNIHPRQLTDTIFLTPKITQLNQVIIRQKKPRIKKIKPKKTKLFFNLKPNSQLGILVQNKKKQENTYIRYIYIPIRNKTYSHSLKKTYNSVIKIHLFSNKNNTLGEPLIDKPIMFFCNQDSKKFIGIDVSEEEIIFNKKGFFICIEMLGKIDNYGNLKKDKLVFPAFTFTNKESKDVLITTYFKNCFSRNGQWEVAKDYDAEFLGYTNFIIGLTLETHEN